jgi:hypothetical protein
MSVSSLSRQLEKLREEEPLELQQRAHVSFLFDRIQATTVASETLWILAQEGLTELITLDQRFAKFQDTLFNSSTKDFDRQLQTKALNSKLDESLSNFLSLLSPYFLLQASHKTIEYLIRKYRLVPFL